MKADIKPHTIFFVNSNGYYDNHQTDGLTFINMYNHPVKVTVYVEEIKTEGEK